MRYKFVLDPSLYRGGVPKSHTDLEFAEVKGLTKPISYRKQRNVRAWGMGNRIGKGESDLDLGRQVKPGPPGGVV